MTVSRAGPGNEADLGGACDVRLQALELVVLLHDSGFHNVADADDADQCASVYYRLWRNRPTVISCIASATVVCGWRS